MRHAGNNDAIDVGEDFDRATHRIPAAHSILREDCAGFLVRRNRSLCDVFAIIRNPVRDLVKMRAELFRRNIAEILHAQLSFLAKRRISQASSASQ